MQNKDIERAKQFLPFDAIKGFKEALREKEKEKDIIKKKEFDEDYNEELNNSLKYIDKGDIICINYYLNDEYKEVTASFKRIDYVYKKLYLDGFAISNNNIINIKRIKETL